MRTSSPGPPGRASAALWRRWLFPAAIAAGLVTLLALPRGGARGAPLSYTGFVADVGAGMVRAVTIGPAGQVAGSLAAAAAIGGGITAAAATTSHASSQPAASQPAAATVRTVQATVGGKTETILVNRPGPAAVLLPVRHGGEVGRHRGTGGAVAAADVRVTGRHRADRQARRGHGCPRRPGRLQRAPAVHLRRRPGWPGDRPGSAGLLRGHPRPHADHRVPGPGRPVQPLRLLTRPGAPVR
jgi:hypothetical protein